jgi:ankyrin repeat protein
VREFLKHGADENSADKADIPLHIISYNELVDMLRELLKHGADVKTAEKKVIIL